MWSAIVNVMTKMFDALHSLIVSLGVSENAEGVSYVLAIVLFTAIIRLLKEAWICASPIASTFTFLFLTTIV